MDEFECMDMQLHHAVASCMYACMGYIVARIDANTEHGRN